MLKDFTPRLYQQTILGTAAHKNTLVVLPTGLGKTAIAFLLAAQRLHLYPSAKILMLSPTKPLCEQHVETFRNHLDLPTENVVIFTGNVPPEKRAALWKDAQIIISTPQGLENDIINSRINLEEVALLIFDESHHATGDYSYVWIAQQYDKLARYPRILALTASPGNDLDTIKEVCKNLLIERVEVRTEFDPDVKPYIQSIKINWIPVQFPEQYKKVQHFLKNCSKSKIIEAQKYGYCHKTDPSRTELLLLQGELQKKISSGERDFELLRSISLVAEVLKVEHALELLESQGIVQTYDYLHKIQQEAPTSKVKAVKNLVVDENFKSALYLTEQVKEIEHPKLAALLTLVQKAIQDLPNAKIIIFTQFRSSAEQVAKKLTAHNLSHNLFVGQAKKNGLGFSQKQQNEILDRFRIGGFSVLIATSVAEEGLDIPKVDKVIFYEPVPSAIRSIQRRGRTGRLEKGEVNILLTAGTRDEAYRWSAHHKEKRMYRNLEQLRKEFSLTSQDTKKSSLHNFTSNHPLVAIVADHREKDNKVVKELIELGVAVKTAQLEAADYILSGKVGVELKKVPDFVASIIDGRLLEQLPLLKQQFEKAAVIIEGEEDIYSVRKVHANAIRGMLSTIALDFNLPLLYSKNPKETAGLLAVMAKREQDKARDFSYHDYKPPHTEDQLGFVISSFPGIGVQTAHKLLQQFRTIRRVVNATMEELEAVEGVGPKTASRLHKFFEQEYGNTKLSE